MSSRKPDALEHRPLTEHEHAAIAACAKGEATEYQQQLTLKVIVENFSRANDLAYSPGSPDETAFLNGRAFVGKRIQYYVNKAVGQNQKPPQKRKNQ